MAEQVTYWRVGSKVHRTLYRGDELIGMVDTPALAMEGITAVNARGRSLVEVAATSIEAFADRLGLEHFADRPGADRDEQLVAQGMRQAVEIMRRIAERESGRERSPAAPHPRVVATAVCGSCYREVGVTPGARDHVVSVRLTAEESAYLDQLTDVHVTDRSSLLRHLILSAPLWRLTPVEPVAKPECLCDLHETGTIFGPPEYTRGRSNGCLVHPASAAEREMVEGRAAS